MKYLLITISFLFSLSSFSQDIESAQILNTETHINTIGGNSVVISLNLDFSPVELNGYIIDNSTFNSLNSNLKTNLISKRQPNIIDKGERITLQANPHKISFEIENASYGLISLLKDKEADIYITTNSEIIFEVTNGSNTKKLKITPLQIEKHTQNNMILTKLMGEELINARGGDIFVSQNNFEFGVIPSEQASSGKTEYNASFQYRTKYSFLNTIPIYFYTKGLISTNSKDSLNFISIYPVNYNFIKGKNELVGQLGVEGNQTFSNYRISGNICWNGLINNLLDLTFGENRLRLKPVISIGGKIYKEIENNKPSVLSSNDLSNQIYGKCYYNIPIQKIYSLILDGTAYYDFNTQINPKNKLMYNYSLTLGVDIPKTDFKTIFKYTKGNNFVTRESNDYLMIGLLIDLLVKR
ncbi:hypothetical protein [Parabacteroides sp. FAFU027]|uniref:hypothetical protein n=1 Tax=Parabacteroides sp. FAFU027 TaxID=2922715 RepID=UPI001FAE9AA5|nr:hypothetical protein [Parabacteroides sp. FAFU027]